MILYPPKSIAFNLFGIEIYWYGVIMATAILVAILAANKLFNSINNKKNIIIDYAPLIIICGILGARIYFCSLNFSYYIKNIIEIFDIREGGLSIHGAIIGGIFSLIYIAKKQKINFLKITDSCACTIILGQAIGRWGNFFNSEAYGKPIADQSWGLYIAPQYRMEGFHQYNLFHPTFLYESILDIIGYGLLLIIFKNYANKYTGLTLYSYLIIYATIRFFVELIRIDSAAYVGNIPIAIIISTILLIIGLAGFSHTIVKKY